MTALFMRILATVLISCLSIMTAHAHHSVAGEFDGTKPVTLHGILTRIKWENPHIWIYLDVKDDTGRVVNWAVECAPPARIGADVKERLKVGEVITVGAYRARDASRSDAHAYDVVLPDGQRFVIGLRLN
jgi:hypothetical protein